MKYPGNPEGFSLEATDVPIVGSGTESRTPRRFVFPGAVLALALLVADGGLASGRAVTDPHREARMMSETVHCQYSPTEDPRIATLRGDFMGDGREIRLALWNAGPGCVIGRADTEGRAAGLGGGEGRWVFEGGAEFAGACRDPVSGRDHAIVHMSAGQHHDIAIWAAGPAPAPPERLYIEAWGDGVYGEWGIDLLVAADGACLWRERKRRFEIYDAAMAALRVDRGVEAGDGESDDARDGPLPWRAVSGEVVRAQLTALRGIARFEGAVYADADARESWLVVQILGGPLCDSDGAALLLERETGLWQSIYDVPSGCSKAWNFPMRGMVVAGDRIYAALCFDCRYWGDYANFEIDLRAHRAARLDDGAAAPGPTGEENPEIGDIVREILAEKR